MEREITLLLHFIGLGLIITTIAAGSILNAQYRKSTDLQSKATILRALRPVGLLSPVGMLIMLITGIGNMHSLGLGLLTLGWLTAKIIFFAIAVFSGVLFSIISRKRGSLIQQMVAGNAPGNADELLKGYDRQVGLSYFVMPLLLLIILYLSVLGRLGAQ